MPFLSLPQVGPTISQRFSNPLTSLAFLLFLCYHHPERR
nr:MAG TPA: hypothetical protein [Caudoviricetes sp.]